MSILSSRIEARNRNKRGRIAEAVFDGISPTDNNGRTVLRSLYRGVVGAVVIAGVGGLTYQGFIKPYQDDQKWHSESLSIVKQIEQYERENNYRDAEEAENNLWSDIATKKREGSWVKSSEMADIVNRLNNNKTRGASLGEPL